MARARDARASRAEDRARRAASTEELIRRGVVQTAQEPCASLAHGEAEFERTLAAFAEAAARV